MVKSTIVSSTDTAGIEGTNEYGYDASQKRVNKKVTRSGSVVEDTVYIYAGPNCVAEYAKGTAATSPDQEYVYAQAIDSLVMIVRSGGTQKLTVTRNQQWSVSALADNANGTILERYTYDLFGKRTILAADGSTVRTTSSYDNPYGYTSRRHDEESGLMYFRARYYDCSTGEFASQDPLEYFDGMSLMRGYFVLGMVDPTGSRFQASGGGAGAKGACAVALRSNHKNDEGDWSNEVDLYPSGAKKVDHWGQILDLVVSGKCCSLSIFGHRGGEVENPGGATSLLPPYTYSETGLGKDGPKNRILPDAQFEQELKQAFANNGCPSCSINIVTCGPDLGKDPGSVQKSVDRHNATRQTIAQRTGCTTCGSDQKVNVGGWHGIGADGKWHDTGCTTGDCFEERYQYRDLDNFGKKCWGTRTRNPWPKTCVSPDFIGPIQELHGLDGKHQQTDKKGNKR